MYISYLIILTDIHQTTCANYPACFVDTDFSIDNPVYQRYSLS